MKPMTELMKVFAVCTAVAGLAIGAGVVNSVEEQRFHEAQRKYPGQWVFGLYDVAPVCPACVTK